jgi:uncharacterized membrane protein YdjX (TVP38/TMEM64 family)
MLWGMFFADSGRSFAMRTAHDMPLRGNTQSRSASSSRRPLYRWLPLVIVLSAVAVVWALGINRYFSFSMIAENRQALRLFVSGNFILSVAVYALVYFAATALLLPAAALLTMLGGFLFGWAVAGAVTVIAATLGATFLFMAARSSFGDLLVKKGGTLVGKLARGFANDAFSYLLFLRLVPVFPFFVVNIAPALCSVKTRTFFLATLIGIIPATFAYAVLGSGLDSMIQSELLAYQQCAKEQGAENCIFAFHPVSLLSPQIIAAFLLLGAMALVAPLLKHLKATKSSG